MIKKNYNSYGYDPKNYKELYCHRSSTFCDLGTIGAIRTKIRTYNTIQLLATLHCSTIGANVRKSVRTTPYHFWRLCTGALLEPYVRKSVRTTPYNFWRLCTAALLEAYVRKSVRTHHTTFGRPCTAALLEPYVRKSVRTTPYNFWSTLHCSTIGAVRTKIRTYNTIQLLVNLALQHYWSSTYGNSYVQHHTTFGRLALQHYWSRTYEKSYVLDHRTTYSSACTAT
jgi:hypothetical protein